VQANPKGLAAGDAQFQKVHAEGRPEVQKEVACQQIDISRIMQER
jgi:hypothetical protein